MHNGHLSVTQPPAKILVDLLDLLLLLAMQRLQLLNIHEKRHGRFHRGRWQAFR